MNQALKKIILSLFVLMTPAISFALSPLTHYNDLVAGEGDLGVEDGPFYSAQFNKPLGLALNGDGSILYVADSANNRIRAIDLNNKNEVGTITGTGVVGNQNGLLSKATFNDPIGLVYVGDEKLVVNDAGNNLFRLIDLKTGIVSTLAGGGNSDLDGDALKMQLSGVWNMVYLPTDKCLYFSEPEAGMVKVLSLETGNISTLIQKNPLIPKPAALCALGDKVYVADKDSGKVYEMFVTDSSKDGVKTKPSASLSGGWSGGHEVVALAGFGTSLYAYDGEPGSQTSPINQVLPNSAPLTFVSVWGDVIAQASAVLPYFAGVNASQQIGFIPDPRSEGRFYITNPTNCTVASFRDLDFAHFTSDRTAGSLAREFSYPKKKPFRTYRILVTGVSYMLNQYDRKWSVAGSKEDSFSTNIMTLMSKRLELYLNTLASLEDVPLHFEVFNEGQITDSPDYLWPYYDTPQIVKDYDIDLTIMTITPYDGLEYYWHAPITPDGIPLDIPDTEFMLKSQKEKFESGPLHDFFELVEKKKMDTSPLGSSQWLSDPELKDMLADIIGRPAKLLQEKYNFIKSSSGIPCKLCLCYFPSGDFRFFPGKLSRSFWEDVASKNGLAFLDLTNDFIVTRYTYFPFSDMVGTDHFSKDGHSFFAQILAYELIKNKIIPFKTFNSQ